MKITIESIKRKCASGNLGSRIQIIKEENELIFEGTLIAPNPCYDVTATFKMQNDIVEVHIFKRPPTGFCIQCIGSIKFAGKLIDVPNGTHTFIFYIDKKKVYEEKLTF